MTQVLEVANGVVSLLLGAAAVAGGALMWFRRMLRRELAPISDRLVAVEESTRRVAAEVSLDSGTSLKDGVYAIASHLGVELVTSKVEIRPRRETE